MDTLGALVFGYSSFAMLSYKYVFDRSGLVRQKLSLESEIQFERSQFLEKHELVEEDEYPLKRQLDERLGRKGGSMRLWRDIKPE